MIRNFQITPANRPNLWKQVEALDPTRQWVCNITEKKSKRSIEQNDWARKYARDFGKHFGMDADSAYELLMYKCNPIFINEPFLGGHKEIRMPGSFSKLNTAQAAEVQELMAQYGLDLGFYWDEAA